MTIILSENIGNAKHFYWYESNKNGQISISTKTIQENIIMFADYLDTIRGVLGSKPMRITSWYRSPNYNRMIGGASSSQHLKGKAIDFSIEHLALPEAYSILDRFHGEVGGLGLYPGHIHLDMRGYKARWKKNKY